MLYFLILLIILLALPSWRWQKQKPMKHWYRDLDLKKHLFVFNQLFSKINGFTLSQEARSTGDAMEYTYGEIDFVSFIALISLTHPSSNTVFYDLGSGTGKAVFACAMVFDIKKSCGIELFAPLHQAASSQQYQLHKIPEYRSKAKTIHLMNKNFLHADFNDATLIFINATALFGDTWITLTERLQQTAPSTIIITTSKKLSSNLFTLVRSVTVQMSWGLVEAHIHQHTNCAQTI
jgi:hypothetical protein